MNEEDYTPPKQEETQVEQPAATVTCTALTLSTNTVTFEEAEQFYGITYTREPADCTEEVLFSSDNESIATVNQQGKIGRRQRGQRRHHGQMRHADGKLPRYLRFQGRRRGAALRR